MASPKTPSRSFSSAGKLKKDSPYFDAKASSPTLTITPRSATIKSKHPFVQDSLNRLTSPYKKVSNNNIFEGSPLSPSKSYSVITPKKIRPITAGQVDSPGYLMPSTDDARYGFPRQDITDANLRDSLITLKTFMREYEEKQKEKKILQKVVDQLRLQVQGLNSRKATFSKNFEKLHKDALDFNESAASKENQRVLIGKNVSQARDAVIAFDREIQQYILQNVEVAKMIQQEQEEITRIKAELAEHKKIIPIISKEKEKARSDLQVSSKLLKKLEDKYTLLATEKGAYLHNINNSNLKKN